MRTGDDGALGGIGAAVLAGSLANDEDQGSGGGGGGGGGVDGSKGGSKDKKKAKKKKGKKKAKAAADVPVETRELDEFQGTSHRGMGGV